MITTSFGPGGAAGGADADEALSTRLRDLALVDLDALVAGTDASGPRVDDRGLPPGRSPAEGRRGLVEAFADDVADALREARARIATLRATLGGTDPLSVLDATVRQRASDSGAGGATRTTSRLAQQAEAARSLARLADLASGLVGKLFEADRRR